jgi:hypothetical protein
MGAELHAFTPPGLEHAEVMLLDVDHEEDGHAADPDFMDSGKPKKKRKIARPSTQVSRV